MKTIIFGEGEDSLKLKELVISCLEDLGLNDFIEIEISNSDELKQELSITKTPALIIEEESIEFKDMIFEGQIPPEDEIKSMFISIIGGSSDSSCSPIKCSSGCSCG
ncbi:MAG: hypothetical protein WC850_02315 [Candidatus Gracilibacteria bacterium]